MGADDNLGCPWFIFEINLAGKAEWRCWNCGHHAMKMRAMGHLDRGILRYDDLYSGTLYCDDCSHADFVRYWQVIEEVPLGTPCGGSGP